MPDLQYLTQNNPLPGSYCRAAYAYAISPTHKGHQHTFQRLISRLAKLTIHRSSQYPPTPQELPMNLTVTGHHVDVTSSMRNYVAEKMERLQRHSENLFGIHVILSVEKVRQKAEATIEVAGAKLYADTTEPDMYAAIDLLTDKLDRQLIRHKEKQKKHRRDKEPDIE